MALNSHIMLVPHHPALLVDSRNDHESEVQEVLREKGAAYRAAGVEVIVMLSGGWNHQGPFLVDNGSRLSSLQEFAGLDVDLHYSCSGWRELADALQSNGLANGVPVEVVHRGLDHAASVPLSYMFPHGDRRVVLLSVSPRSIDDYRTWGMVVRETCRGAGAECAIIVGGSLTWDAEAMSQGKDIQAGADLDRRLLTHLEAAEWDGFMGMDDASLERGSAYAGLLHLRFLEGVLQTPQVGHILAYQRHPGVGSAVVEFELSPQE
jgi:aromatic ring-opening dioxygenase catalytic subunit (LigB family)